MAKKLQLSSVAANSEVAVCYAKKSDLELKIETHSNDTHTKFLLSLLFFHRVREFERASFSTFIGSTFCEWGEIFYRVWCWPNYEWNPTWKWVSGHAVLVAGSWLDDVLSVCV